MVLSPLVLELPQAYVRVWPVEDAKAKSAFKKAGEGGPLISRDK